MEIGETDILDYDLIIRFSLPGNSSWCFTILWFDNIFIKYAKSATQCCTHWKFFWREQNQRMHPQSKENNLLPFFISNIDINPTLIKGIGRAELGS